MNRAIFNIAVINIPTIIKATNATATIADPSIITETINAMIA
jgi:hypothetical protein